MLKDPTEFRKRFAAWKNGKQPYKNGRISDEEYIRIMEKVAADNWGDWGDDSEDAALTRALNDNAYDYRGYYSKYPKSAANADTHWSDEFKTVWHPTFSVYSKYSGEKSLYNPEGILGGRWDGDRYIPAWGLKLPNKKDKVLAPYRYKDGKLPGYYTGTEGEMDQRNDDGALDARTYLQSFINSPGFVRIGNNNNKLAKKDYPKSYAVGSILSSIFPEKSIGPSYNKDHIIDYKKSAEGLNEVNIYKHDVGSLSNSYYEYDGHTGQSGVHLYGNHFPEYNSQFEPFFAKSFVEAHELRHALRNDHTDAYTDTLLNNLDWGHGNKKNEKLSDVFGLRYLLYKEGIYDSRKNKDVSPNHIKKLRQKYPKLRPLLKTKDDTRVAFLLNNIFASNNNIQYENNNRG